MSKKRLFLVTFCLILASVWGNVFGQNVTINASATELTCEQTSITLFVNLSDSSIVSPSFQWIKIPAGVVDLKLWYAENEENLTPFEIGRNQFVTVTEAAIYAVIVRFQIGQNWVEISQGIEITGGCENPGQNPFSIYAPTTELSCEQTSITLFANLSDSSIVSPSFQWIKVPQGVDFQSWYVENIDNLTPFEIGTNQSVTVTGAGIYLGTVTFPIGENFGTTGDLIEITGGCSVIVGCMDPFSLNYNPYATVSNDSCFYRQITDTIIGCRDSLALSYNPLATIHRQSDCVYNATDTIYGCNDYKALNYNPFATAYDNSCIYASEENIFIPEITETPIDTVGTRPTEDCRLSAGLGITSAVITGITPLGENKIIVHWEIVQNGEPILYNVEYTVIKEGNNLFYLSIICKEGTLRAKSLRSGAEKSAGVTGYTVSAIFNVDFETVGVCSPMATNTISVYPNPTTGIVNIGQQAEIKVYSLQGALLQETFGTQVNLSAYPQGIYQLQINGEAVKVVKK